MSRMLDELLRAKRKVMRKEEFDMLQSAVLIDGTPVTNYMYEVNEDSGWDLKDFPNLAPPFDIFAIECKAPKKMRIGKQEHPWAVPSVEGWVLLAVAVDRETANRGIRDRATEWSTSGLITNEKTKWVLWVELFLKVHAGAWGPGTGGQYPHVASLAFPIDGEGKITGISSPEDDRVYALVTHTSIKEGDGLESFMMNITEASLMTICFMHCKNVIVHTNEPSKQLQKKALKRYGMPLLRYKTLEIQPMKTILKREGNQESQGIQHALHICRGHFKDFRQGPGLGRYHAHGLYWWDAMVRGTSEKGVVGKDYEVHEAKNATTDTATER